MKSFIGIILLSLSLAACVKVSSDSEESSTPASSATSQPVNVEPSDNLDVKSAAAPVQIRALPEPMRYQVLLPLPPSAQVVQRSLRTDDLKSVILPIQLKDGVFIDEQPESGSEYVYEAGLIQDGNFLVLETFTVKIPRDFVVDTEYELSKNTNWDAFDGRVFLTSKGIITTNGFSFSIQTGEVVSDSGLIRSFRSGSQAAQGYPGQSGGNIHILSRTATGKLTIEMRGQAGGKGLKGADWKKFGDGHQGPNPGNGKAAGESGPRGGDGYRGGNSGSFEIKLTEAHNLMIFRTIESGVGGFGGPGGKGSPAIEYWNLLEGAQGEEGRPGTSGDREFSYLLDLTGRTPY